ncbi:MAG: hypothetical protein B6242_07985 [Anaerolineaceae bacterium 4572_78]|nr:MAG: hypothetical protein B6242_07985 [Anaerolineaceae bacterium 4572_78]
MSVLTLSMKQQLLTYIDRLSEQQLQTAYDFVGYLLFRSKPDILTNVPEVRQNSIESVLQKLDEIRTKYAQEHGVYQGNPVAEVRAERMKQFDEVLGV